uniref:Uncharacterized protein n=1 Tax=Arion vulgaris TaxID=1028688 RepID=A0A0B6ZBS6_9EUPU
MSVNKLVQGLGQLCLSQSRFSEPVKTCVRQFHGTTGNLKNFNSRLPKNIKLPRYRFETNVDVTKYTLTPLKTAKTGGRGPDGKIWIHRIGGGDKRLYRMVDNKRVGPQDGPPLVERVTDVLKDDIRSASLAVVAGGNRKRYILASENMKTGDLIETSGQLTTMTVQAKEGDAHPVGSLPLGTIVHNIERYAGQGGMVALAAGTSGVYLRKIGDKCVIRMPSKREMVVSQQCMVTVGRVSNVDHYITKKMKTPQESRWRGIRPKSGWWQRKTGYHGRKINPMRPAIIYDKQYGTKPEVFRFTV